MTIVASPGSTAGGTRKSTRSGETDNTGAGIPSTVTEGSASSKGNCSEPAVLTPKARFAPKAVAIESGVSRPSLDPAAFARVNAEHSTTRTVTTLVSLNRPSLAVKVRLKLLPVSAAVGVHLKVPSDLLLVTTSVVKRALAGSPSAVIESGTPEPRSLATTLNLISLFAAPICATGTVRIGGRSRNDISSGAIDKRAKSLGAETT